MPDFDISTLGESSLATGWKDSLSSFDESEIRFLTHGAITESASWTELSRDAIVDCLAAADRIKGNTELRQLAWHAYRLLYRKDPCPKINDWPRSIPSLDSYTGTFYLILALAGIEHMHTLHQTHGIPVEVTRLNCYDIHIWANEYKTLGEPADHGFVHTFEPAVWGLHTRGFRWITGSLTGRILRIGRLQFIHNTFTADYQAYRHRKSRKVQLLARKGHRFTKEGWEAQRDANDFWPSELTAHGNRIRATPITPDGRAHNAPITLDTNEWDLILAPGDPILEVHIPEDGPMGFDDCGQSIREAIRNYATWIPEKPFHAIVCGSWLLDPQYQDGMPETSNICRFQKECYLFPNQPGGGRSGFFRLFTHDDLSALPRDTVMRRTYLDLLNAGGLWRGGGMVLFPEDLDWGKQVYLRQHKLV